MKRNGVVFCVLISAPAIAAACTSALGDFSVGAGGASGSGSNGAGASASTSTGSSSTSSSMGQTTSSTTGSGGGGTVTCPAGRANCDMTKPDCETNLNTDRSNCGACGVRCLNGGTCEQGQCDGVTQLADGPDHAGFLALFQDQLYWTAGDSHGGVYKVSVHGGAFQTLAENQPAPFGIAVVAAGVYWANRNSLSVMKMDLNGGHQTNVTSSDFTPLYVAGDDAEIFWSQEDITPPSSGSRIGRIRVSDNTARKLFVSSPGSPFGMWVDHDSLYWVNRTMGTVNRVPRVGNTMSPDTLAQGQATPYAIAVDDTYIFWVNHGDGATVGSVMRLPKVAMGEMPTSITCEGTTNPTAIALSTDAIYWADEGGHSICKAGKDGSSPTVLTDNESGGPHSIAVDANYVYWLNGTDGTVRKIAR